MSFLTSELGLRWPLIQAPMAGVQDHGLAAAVCEAGGLGSLPCAMLDAEGVAREIERLRALTDRPFNLNFFCHTPPVCKPEQLAAWTRAMAHHDATWGIDRASVPPVAGRRPFDADMAEVVRQARPAVVSFHFGLPAEDLLAIVRASGARILSSATTLEEALWLEARGVDAIIAQGLEAGGHRGLFLGTDLAQQQPLERLLPAVVHAVRVPVLAAGGMADAAAVRWARAQGAAGVQVGTAYLLCPESRTSALHRQALQSEAARHTALTNVFTGRPARGIVNRLIEELGPMSDLAPPFPLATAASAPLRARAEAVGCSDFTPLWAGEKAPACRALPAADITRELAMGWDADALPRPA